MAMPNFLIVGAAKAGTTSLHHYLKQHPDIFMPEGIKETFFFSGITRESFPGPGNNYGRHAISTLEDYLKLFNDVQAQKVIGEACVAYLYFYQATIPRIVETLGKDVKIIISLRQPADRAFSNYLHHVRDGLDELPFAEAIKAEPWRKLNRWWWGFEYTAVGFYFNQVKSYFETFGYDRVFIILYDDFGLRPTQTMKAIFKFLDVDDTFVLDMSSKHNVSGIPKNKRLHTFLKRPHPIKSFMRPFLPSKLRRHLVTKLRNHVSANLLKPSFPLETRKALIKTYHEDIIKLQDLIGQDLSQWLKE